MTTRSLTHKTPHTSITAGSSVSHLHRLHHRLYKDSQHESKSGLTCDLHLFIYL